LKVRDAVCFRCPSKQRWNARCHQAIKSLATLRAKIASEKLPLDEAQITGDLDIP